MPWQTSNAGNHASAALTRRRKSSERRSDLGSDLGPDLRPDLGPDLGADLCPDNPVSPGSIIDAQAAFYDIGAANDRRI
jgi:hypothetical protein